MEWQNRDSHARGPHFNTQLSLLTGGVLIIRSADTWGYLSATKSCGLLLIRNPEIKMEKKQVGGIELTNKSIRKKLERNPETAICNLGWGLGGLTLI